MRKRVIPVAIGTAVALTLAVVVAFLRAPRIVDLTMTYDAVHVAIRGGAARGGYALIAWGDGHEPAIVASAFRDPNGLVTFRLPVTLDAYSGGYRALAVVTAKGKPRFARPGLHIRNRPWTFANNLWAAHRDGLLEIARLERESADARAKLERITAQFAAVEREVVENATYRDGSCHGPLPPRDQFACDSDDSREVATAMCVAAAGDAARSCQSFARLVSPNGDRRIYNYLSGPTCTGLAQAFSNRYYTLEELLGDVVVGQINSALSLWVKT